MGIVAFSFIILFLCSVDTQASSDGDSCWSNISNIACTDKNGCNAQNVYQYCTFYVNFWNPNGNLKMRTASVTIKRNGTIVASDTRSSSDSNHYFNWCNMSFCLDTAGTYTVERKVTCLDGSVLSFDTKSMTLYPVSQCGSTLSLSSSSMNLNMTSNKSSTITATVGGITPEKRTLAWSCSDTSVISLSWGSWSGNSAPLTITGKAGGSAVVTIYFKETSSGTVITQKSFNVTVGPNYTVSYNANGGSGAPSSQTKYYGKTLTLSSTKPTRTGYIFKGWALHSSASTASYSAGDPYYNNSGVTLYAVWELEQYKVSYDANGGSGAPSSQIKYYGQTLTLSSTKPTRTGYVFKGWATYSSASSATYSAGSSYYNNSGVTLYAVWELEQYTVSYNANGGSGAPSSQIKYYGQTLTLSSTKPIRTGYVFKGWATYASASSATYSAGGLYYDNSKVTLYAVWELEQYIVSYDANGGSGAPSSQIKYYGQKLTLSSLKPTRTGYIFKGWATYASASSAAYSAGSSYYNNSGVTLYAVWTPECYTVYYNANGGSGAPVFQMKYYGQTLTLSSTKPTRTGYIFKGWATYSSASSASYFPGSFYYDNSGVTLYAVWEKEPVNNNPSKDTEKKDDTSKDTSKKPDTKKDPVLKKQPITAYDKTVVYKSSAFFLPKPGKGMGRRTYSSNNKRVAVVDSAGKVTPKECGTAIITIKAEKTNIYQAAEKKIKITVIPKSVNLKKVTPLGNGRLKAVWGKTSAVDGYHVYISLSKDFSHNTRQKYFKNKVNNAVWKDLTAKKNYYIKVRTYKTVNGKKMYSAWSRAKAVKVK